MDLELELAEAAVLSLDAIRQTLRAALSQYNGGKPYEQACWLRDAIGDEAAGDVIYEMGDVLYRAPYVITASGKARSVSVQMSKSERVFAQTVYVRADQIAIEASRQKLLKMMPQPATVPSLPGETEDEAVEESEAEITGEVVALKEGAVGLDGSMAVKLIAPGKGSTGFYSEAVLKQAAKDKVFPKGLHMYWNHQTESEERERPEGDLRDLAAVLTQNAYYDGAGAEGPGLYARAQATEAYAKSIDNLAKNIGVSIRAFAQAKPGKDVPTIERLTRGLSCDFVTRAGAGGKILQLFEAARPTAKPQKECEDMTKDEVQALVIEAVKPLQETIAGQNTTMESQAATITELRTRAIRGEASALVAESLSVEKLPDGAKQRITAKVLESIPVTDKGELDGKKLAESLTAAIKVEAEYISSIRGRAPVTGFGPAKESEAPKPAEVEKRIAEAEKGRGATASFAAAYARGRA